MAETPRVLLVEDDAFTRTTLSSALDHHGVQVIGIARSAEEAMALVRPDAFDCAVLDLDLGIGPTGIDIAHAIRRVLPQVGIVLLTSFTDPRLLAASLREIPVGSAYVVKQSLHDMAILIEAIRGATAMAGSGVPPEAISGLTPAQIETLRLLACGLSNAEIARVRSVTEKSIEQAISRAAKRLGIESTTEVNQRVALAREYFRLTGAARHARP